MLFITSTIASWEQKIHHRQKIFYISPGKNSFNDHCREQTGLCWDLSISLQKLSLSCIYLISVLEQNHSE